MGMGINWMHASSPSGGEWNRFELVQSAFENCGDTPGSSERVGQLFDKDFRSVRSSSIADKHNVTDGTSARIWVTGVHEIRVIGYVLLDKELSGFTKTERRVTKS